MPGPFTDVRMTGFGKRAAVSEVVALLSARVRPLSGETIFSTAAAGRVLAAPVASPVDVPGFEKSAMDGYAVRAADLPGTLAVIGDALPARPCPTPVGPGQAVRVMTGAPIPVGADAVVPVEQTELVEDRIVVARPVPAGKHVVRVGEDVTAGRELLRTGRRLRPADVGILAAVGVASVAVVGRPRVAVLVTGDELLPPGAKPDGYRIVDSNSPMLAALVGRDGGDAGLANYVPDRFESVRSVIAAANADVILVSGGTSVGTEDHAPRAVADLGELAVHGIAVKPAGPTGVGFLPDGRVVFLLPGNPTACLCAYDLFAGRAIRRLGGRPWDLPYRTVECPMTADVRSAVGRVDYLRVKIAFGHVDLVPGGASGLSSAVAADGFILIDADSAAVSAGDVVTVNLYD